MLLSILTPTVEDRKEQFAKLKKEITKQVMECDAHELVEHLFVSDNYIYPVGLKRNLLVQNAKGKYVASIDDDDAIANDYVSTILDVIKYQDVDCLGLTGIITFDGENPKKFIHSIKYKTYFETKEAYFRPPNHLNCLRKEIMAKYPFPIKSRGEDTDMALAMAKQEALKSEVFIDKVLYFYKFSYANSATFDKNRILEGV